MRGRKRAEDATIKFHKNGKVVVVGPKQEAVHQQAHRPNRIDGMVHVAHPRPDVE
jgi:hypothetical protein